MSAPTRESGEREGGGRREDGRGFTAHSPLSHTQSDLSLRESFTRAQMYAQAELDRSVRGVCERACLCVYGFVFV